MSSRYLIIHTSKGIGKVKNISKDNRENILNDLSIITNQSTQNKKLSEQIANTVSVSLHIRRGDYISNSAYNATSWNM